MLNQIFNPENGLFRMTGKVFDLVVLSALWLLCSLPVVTVGSATAALYYSAVKCVRRDEEHLVRNFFHSFQENLRAGIPVTLIALVVALFLNWGRSILLAAALEQGGALVAVYIAYLVALIAPIGVVCYAFPLLSRFAFGPVGLISAAFKLALGHLPATVVMVITLAAAVSLCVQNLLLSMLPLLLCPAVVALVWSLFLERIFKGLMPQEEQTETDEDEGKPWYLR